MHRATLLHYVAANGVEGYRQRTPGNAVAVARTLLDAGAAPDAVADMYGGSCTTMSMLVSSDHPARAGVQVALVDTLVDFGASVEPQGDGSWASPLLTALTFGFPDAAEALVRRGARVETAAAAAGLNRPADLDRLLPIASAEDRHRALALAAQLGHPAIVERLLDAGEDPNRYNPKAGHSHTHAASPGGVARACAGRAAARRARRTAGPPRHDLPGHAARLGRVRQARRDRSVPAHARRRAVAGDRRRS